MNTNLIHFLALIGGITSFAIVGAVLTSITEWLKDTSPIVKEYSIWIRAGRPDRICNACQVKQNTKQTLSSEGHL